MPCKPPPPHIHTHIPTRPGMCPRIYRPHLSLRKRNRLDAATTTTRSSCSLVQESCCPEWPFPMLSLLLSVSSGHFARGALPEKKGSRPSCPPGPSCRAWDGSRTERRRRNGLETASLGESLPGTRVLAGASVSLLDSSSGLDPWRQCQRLSVQLTPTVHMGWIG